MKFTLSWLKEHLQTKANVDEIVERLIQLGLEVDEVEDPGEKYKGFMLAEITSHKKHPDADRLNVCSVNTGNETLTIVCGGTNVRDGMKVALAPVGVVIPSTGDVLKKGKIRGIESQGMMCSEDELDLGKGPEGAIMDLKTELPVGTPLSEVLSLNDPVIHLSITPNRSDCFSIHGIARDLSASGLGQLKQLHDAPIPKVSERNPIMQADKCYAFYIARMQNVKNTKSPDYITSRLKAAGIKSQNFLVDITNYIALDLGQPMHIHDGKNIKNIGVRNAKDGEELECLNEETFKLKESDLIITSDDKALAIAGIMGSQISAVTDSTDEILIESAYFDPVNIALTGQRLNLLSESRTRFERGVDSAMTRFAFYKAIEIIKEVCGGKVTEKFIYEKLPEQKSVLFNINDFEKRSGFKISKDKIKNYLENLGMEPQENAEDILKIKIPTWRHDIERPEDIIEELMRLEGYDQIISTSLPLKKSVVDCKQNIKEVLMLKGLIECYTWSFISREKFDLFSGDEPIEIGNPISQSMSVMRPSLFATLLEVTLENTNRSIEKTAFFEIAKTYQKSGDKINEVVNIAGIRTNVYNNRQWHTPQRKVDAFDAKADALSVLSAYDLTEDKLQLSTDTPSYYHPGRSGAWKQGKRIIGYFGEIHPRVLEAYDIKGPAVGFEILLDNIPEIKKKKNAKLSLSSFPLVPRDLSFIVKNDVPASHIVESIQKVNKELIHDVSVFDVYAGKGIEEGKKAIGVEFNLQSTEKTLNEEDIQTITDQILKQVEDRCGGVLRNAS